MKQNLNVPNQKVSRDFVSNNKPSSPLKWHGGKFYLAEKLVKLMPQHVHYVEPYLGGGSVMFAKDPEGVSEVANDLNGSLMNFYQVLQSPALFEKFSRRIAATPFSERGWEESLARLSDPEAGNSENRVRWARDLFITVRQSRSGLMRDFAPLSRNRVRRGMNEQASAWLSAVEGLPQVHERLRRVVLLNRPAIDVIQSQDGPKTLFYLDPPYPKQTRIAQDAYGAFEMTDADHRQLLDVIRALDGKVMISSYANPLYEKALTQWNRHDFEQAKHSGGSSIKSRAVESVYCNF